MPLVINVVAVVPYLLHPSPFHRKSYGQKNHLDYSTAALASKVDYNRGVLTYRAPGITNPSKSLST